MQRNKIYAQFFFGAWFITAELKIALPRPLHIREGFKTTEDYTPISILLCFVEM